MITEIPYAHLPEPHALRADPQAAGVLAAVAAGNSRARLWVDGSAGLLWDQANNVLYQAGPALADWDRVWAEIRSAAVQLGRRRLGVRGLGPGTPERLLAGLALTRLAQIERCFYAYHPAAITPPPEADADTRFAVITAAWLAGPALVNLDRVRAEVDWMWPARERFAAQGFGIAAVRAATVVCWCTAEYVGPATCGLGIETDAAWQRQGLATATAARAVAHALRLGLHPHWECDRQNTASVRLAEKLGFTRVLAAPYWTGWIE